MFGGDIALGLLSVVICAFSDNTADAMVVPAASLASNRCIIPVAAAVGSVLPEG